MRRLKNRQAFSALEGYLSLWNVSRWWVWRKPALGSRAKTDLKLTKKGSLPVLCELNPFDYSICTLNQFHSWLDLKAWTWVPMFLALRSPLMRTRTGKAFKSFEDWKADPCIANTARELYGDIDRLAVPWSSRWGSPGIEKQESNTVDSTLALRVMDSYSMLLLWYALFLQYIYQILSICPTDS